MINAPVGTELDSDPPRAHTGSPTEPNARGSAFPAGAPSAPPLPRPLLPPAPRPPPPAPPGGGPPLTSAGACPPAAGRPPLPGARARVLPPLPQGPTCREAPPARRSAHSGWVTQGRTDSGQTPEPPRPAPSRHPATGLGTRPRGQRICPGCCPGRGWRPQSGCPAEVSSDAQVLQSLSGACVAPVAAHRETEPRTCALSSRDPLGAPPRGLSSLGLGRGGGRSSRPQGGNPGAQGPASLQLQRGGREPPLCSLRLTSFRVIRNFPNTPIFLVPHL